MRVVALVLLALCACGDRPVSAEKAREVWGDPCFVDKVGPSTETWTYCVVPCGDDGSLCDTHCAPECPYWQQLTLSDGYVVAMDRSASLDAGTR